MGLFDIFKRGAKVAEANLNKAVDKIEDPVLMTEQAIRDMKKDLEAAMTGHAGIKSQAKLAEKDAEKLNLEIKKYTDIATRLKGNLSGKSSEEITSAEKKRDDQIKEGIIDALNSIENLKNEKSTKVGVAKNINAKSEHYGKKIKMLRDNIKEAENTLGQLKAQSEVAKAEKKMNKDLAGLDSSGAQSMLKRMQEKVNQEEALAESYGEMADDNKSLDDKLNDLLTETSPTDDNQLLNDFLKK